MKITYIHHSSFAAETGRVSLLFDYFKGTLPEFRPDLPLLVFVSHFHADHFSPVIFELAEKYQKVQFILSKDINPKKIPDSVRDRVLVMKAHETRIIRAGETEVSVETLRSTDSGVAYWISCEGKTFYHAGDLNNWWWDGEDKAWNHNMAASYRHEMERLSGRHADFAFVPVDPRLGQWFYLGLQGFLEKVDADVVFPMHFWEDYSIIEKMKQHPAGRDFADRIADISREGEEYTYAD